MKESYSEPSKEEKDKQAEKAPDYRELYSDVYTGRPKPEDSETGRRMEAVLKEREIIKQEKERNLQRKKLNLQYDYPTVINVRSKEIDPKTNEAVETETGEKIEVVDLKPDNQRDEVPIAYLKGFASTNESCRELMISIAMCGNRVMAMDNPHGIGSGRITEEEKEKALQNQKELSDVELRKTAMFLEAMEQKGVEKTDIVAYSEGAIYAVVGALMHPEKVRNLVLIDPAGMIGQDKFFDLIKRSAEDTMLGGENIKKKVAGIDPYRPDKELSADETKELQEAGKEAKINSGIGQKTWLGTWGSGPVKNIEAISAIAKGDIAFALKFLRQEYGIKVGIIHSYDDKIFPMEWVREDLTEEMVDGSYSINGTHTSFTQNPEKYAPLIDDLRAGLQRKREKYEEDRPLDSFL